MPPATSPALARDLMNALFPAQCLGCGQWDTPLCDHCSALVNSIPHRWELLGETPNDIPLVVAGKYAGPLRNIILALKHNHALDGKPLLLRIGGALGFGLLNSGIPPCAASATADQENIWVIPAPPSWKRRLSGHSITDTLALGLARVLANETQRPVTVVNAISLRVGASSQASRSGEERRLARKGQMRLRLPVPSSVDVVIVDDVVTTGATMLEMVAILGRHPWAALAIARA